MVLFKLSSCACVFLCVHVYEDRIEFVACFIPKSIYTILRDPVGCQEWQDCVRLSTQMMIWIGLDPGSSFLGQFLHTFTWESQLIKKDNCCIFILRDIKYSKKKIASFEIKSWDGYQFLICEVL